MVIVRMPPSPTGFLHLGTARTALFNYLFAKKQNGNIIFRWEDTDKERSRAEFEREILDGLRWLGMDFEKESSLFCRQSENLDVHKQWLGRLWEDGKVFPCFVTPEELDHQRQKAQENKQNFVFWSPFRDKNKDELESLMASGTPYVWRLKSPRDFNTQFTDLIRGDISVSSETLGDFVVARSDGSVLYLLANVIDDWTQEVTHVFRGEDHISNTPKQVLLYNALGAKPPQFGHIPLVLDKSKRKLSKRNVDPDVCVLIRDFQASGFVPEAVMNGLALTGWNPKTTEEIFSLQDLISLFDVAGINPSAAQYNFEKMQWLNTQWIRSLDLGVLRAHMETLFNEVFDASIEPALDIARQKSRTLHDVREQVSYFVSDPGIEVENLWHEKMGVDMQTVKTVFPELIKALQEVDDSSWTLETIREVSVGVIESLQLKNGQVLHPFRIALSNHAVSAPPFDIAEYIGKKETIRRLERVLEKLS